MEQIVFTARCVKCDWKFEGPRADKEAEKHSKQQGHPTISSADPVTVQP